MPHTLTARQDVRVRRDARDLRTLYYIVLAGLFLLSVGLGLLWCRNKVTSAAYEISQATARRDALRETSRRLRLDIERERSPQRIEKIASDDLGLVHPSGAQIVNIK
ncbi:MAG: cell division protein FtsL [Deltaproteobacteria bacterium]|nr:cell division protein FtsL [Deltaproteobacteria bacterium]